MKRIVVLLLAVVLAACSTTSTIHQPHSGVTGQACGFTFRNQGGDDEEGIAQLERTIRDSLSSAGLLAVPGSEAGTIEVTLRHYYLRSNGARFWAGVMAGRDKIISDVRVLDADGNVTGSFQVESTNTTALGTSDGLREKHAQEIVDNLR